MQANANAANPDTNAANPDTNAANPDTNAANPDTNAVTDAAALVMQDLVHNTTLLRTSTETVSGGLENSSYWFPVGDRFTVSTYTHWYQVATLDREVEIVTKGSQ